MLNKKKYNQDGNKTVAKKGFSLIEVLFSLLVLSIGIVSIVAIMTANIKTSAMARNQIIAAQLTQEGIELVRNLNDNSMLTDKTDYNDHRIDMDAATGEISFPNAGNFRLYLDETSGYYSHSGGGTPTKFCRKIDIDGSVSGKRIVTSEVWWDGPDNLNPPAICNVSNKCITASLVISYTVVP